MAYRSWSESTSANGALLPIPSWREIYKGDSTSTYATLSEIDSSNNIVVTTGSSINPTTIVMMIFRTDGITGMTGGLVTLSNNPSSYISVSTSGSYGVMDLDGGGNQNPSTYWSPAYGGIKAYSIHNLTSSAHNKTYVAVNGSSAHTSTRFFEVNYSIKSTPYQNRWVYNTIYNYTFAAITANFGPEYTWEGTSFTFETNYTYSITVNSYCASNNWEGVVWFDSVKQVDPSTNGYITNLGGLDCVKGTGSKTFDFTPTSDTTYYFYLRASTNGNLTLMRHASIKIVRKITAYLEKNGGTGGTSSITIAPFTAYSDALVTPPTKAGVGGVDYTFKGFFASVNSGTTQYIDSTGKIFDPDRTIRYDDGNVNWTAVWGNTISYQPLTTSIYAWCTPNATVASTTLSAKVKVANAPAKCASGQSLSISYYNSGITNDSTGQYVKFPDGKKTGPYDYYANKTIYLSSPNSSGGGYESMSVSKNIPRIYLSAVGVNTYGSVSATISQHTNIPAAGITISTISGVRDYYTVNPTQTITYTNGATRNGSVSCVLTKSISVSSRGKIYDNSTKVISLNNVSVSMTGEGSKTGYASIAQARQEANIIEDVFVYTSPSGDSSTLYVPLNSAIEIFTGARYTSGETRDLLSEGPEQNVSFGFIVPSFMTVSYIP